MNIAPIIRVRWCILATAALLASCGTAQLPVGPSGAMFPSRSAVTPALQGRDLLYVAADTVTNVFTYPGGKLVSALGGTTGVICSNTQGDVFLSEQNGNFIDEFQHGRATLIAQLSNPFADSQSCSVDPASGSLALVSSAGEGVAIFRPGKRHHWHLPRLYAQGGYLYSCGYDAHGNLFIDGKTQYNQMIFAELPKGGAAFINIALDQAFTTAGTVQWDGQYLAVGDQENTLIRRFSIEGSSGTQIGTVTLSGPNVITQCWIQDAIVTGAEQSNSKVQFWPYPTGGSAIRTITTTYPLGVTVSRPK